MKNILVDDPTAVKDSYEDDIYVKPIYIDQPVDEVIEEKKNAGYITTGTVYDRKTFELLPFTGTFIRVATGQRDTVFTSTDGSYEAWTFDSPDNWLVEFKAKGYDKKNVLFSELLVNGEVQLKKSIPWGILLIVAGAVYLYQKNTKKVGKLSSGDVMPIMLLAGGVLGFSLIKDALEFLGLWKDKDEKELDEVSTDPTSFWSPTYWQTIKPPNKNWTYAISEQTAGEWCMEIWKSFGAFNDDEDKVIGICKRCRTKANFSFLSYVWKEMFNSDFLTYLRGGWWPDDRLSNEDVNEINKYISNLPNY